MEDRSNIIKEAIEYRDKLEKKVEELAQSVVRLQISLDFADNTIKKKDRENAELEAENERLKNRMQTLDEEDITVEITEDEFEEYKQLKAENARLKSCLQEIKEIAETPKPFIDNLEIKSATEVGYDYAAICNELEKRLHKVLELITKAESEEE